MVLGVATAALLVWLLWPGSDADHERCLNNEAEAQPVISGDDAQITAAVVHQRLVCADTVVLVDPASHDSLAAARFAIAENGVILATTMDELATTAGEIEDLDARTIYWAGAAGELDQVADALGRDAKIIENQTPAPGETANGSGQLTPQTLEGLTVAPDAATSEPDLVDARDVFFVMPDDLQIGVLIAPALAQSGGRIAVIDFAAPPIELDEQRPASTLVGNPDPTQLWQYEGFLSNRSVLGGGAELFPDRRFVASYGSPDSPSLGVLGEAASPVEALETLQPLVDSYAVDGVLTLPAFEIIVTVATAEPGSDGDYSSELFLDDVRPWVDFAQEQGVYVILDLQSGRSGFLRQAEIYRELLERPNVGLALDPEWRLYGDQLHLNQIGSVDGAEVEEVSQWLAELVRQNNLPQKLFIVHQFQRAMLTNPELISTPAELATVIHIDGQGDRALKLNTYNVLTATEATDHLWFGWKNFFDEDNPLSTPAEVLELDPAPVVITYQ
ncbi:MAG: hypothetical protein R2706_11590 [Acidimicrobiales bacterium]